MAKFIIREGKTCIYPLGVVQNERGFHVSVECEGEYCAIALYRRNEKEAFSVLDFPVAYKRGRVFAMQIDILPEDQDQISDISGDAISQICTDMEYNFTDGKSFFADPFGKVFSGRDTWGKIEHIENIRRSSLICTRFDWEGDQPLKHEFCDSIIYRMHVRGFTKSPSSKAIHRGTFTGILEKAQYLKDLGITAVCLMPCAEFEEIMLPGAGFANPYAKESPNGKINYWGYTKAYHFAPKASFCKRKTRDVASEFKELVKCLHKMDIEVIIELYFDGTQRAEYVLQVLRYWVEEYHVDGVQLTGFADVVEAAKDPYLANTKIIAQYFDLPRAREFKHLAGFNEGFLIDMRRFLKGDEGMLGRLLFHTKNNPANAAALNYMADVKGFCLMDTVSYDIKHNEKNGENNTDGTDFNYSWNCGVEGPTKKVKIARLRMQQLRNAFMLLFLSQGTPVIASGDEVGKSRQGNNNAYCQDNEMNWFDWKLIKSNVEILEFVRHMIAFRKAHPAFRMPKEPTNLDTLSCGKPDVSYHGVNVWQPDFAHYRRQLGILYWGSYAKLASGEEDTSFYVLYNMHWEGHECALPGAGKDKFWHLRLDSSKHEINGIFAEGGEFFLPDQRKFYIQPRSIVVLVAKSRG